jgi:hypothetical protein
LGKAAVLADTSLTRAESLQAKPIKQVAYLIWSRIELQGFAKCSERIERNHARPPITAR